MFFEDHIDDAKYCGHLYGLGSGSAYVQNGTGNAYEEETNKQQSWHHLEQSCPTVQHDNSCNTEARLWQMHDDDDNTRMPYIS